MARAARLESGSRSAAEASQPRGFRGPNGAVPPGAREAPDAPRLEDIDLEIARLKLASMDVQIDDLTPEQETYLSSWTHGT